MLSRLLSGIGGVCRAVTLVAAGSRLIVPIATLSVVSAPAATYTVSNNNDSGSGSLRQAIIDANLNAGTDTIAFQIPGAGAHSIRPLAALPAITDAVVIDGTSQPGYAGTPLIEVSGALVAPNSTGLRILAGHSTVRGLAINRFGADGILILGGGTNVIQGNFIGTDLSGAASAANTNAGVSIERSAGNLIGGTSAPQRNVISGGNAQGIYIFDTNSTRNMVQGNFIGTPVSGNARLGNRNFGVYVYNAVSNVIGGTVPGSANVLSGNGASGVYLYGANARGNLVQGNLIGLDVSGSLVVSNRGDGISVESAVGNTIGGTTTGARNVISGNGMAGISLYSAARDNKIQGNYIGTDATGQSPRGNYFAGVTLTSVSSNLIGGTLSDARNVISGNRLDGIFINTNANSNRVEGNFIGINAAGSGALANGYSGVSIDSASGNAIGGTAVGARNVISGNGGHGVWIFKPAASGNQVQGNFIGTDAAGRLAVKNLLAGVKIEESAANRVGGSELAGRNVISGNGEQGVFLVGSQARQNMIQGNFVGTDLNGTARLGNGGAGIGLSDAPANVVGGTLPGARNLVSANGDAGIFLMGPGASGNTIQGNSIGTDLTGTLARNNRYEGIYLSGASSNVIGGAVADAGNLVSGGNNRGLYFLNASWNIVEGNFIGTQADGVSALGNRNHAIEIYSGSSHNRIGGAFPAAGNRIAFTQIYTGVRIRDGNTNNLVQNNAIFANKSLGIDLGAAGVSGNDPCDGDIGGNQLQNFPVLTEVVSGGATRIRGTLNSTANRLYVLEFFASPNCDDGQNGEGELCLGQATVTMSSQCLNTFSIELPVRVPPGFFITATATDAANNTSEFFACQPAIALPQPAIGLISATHATLSWPETLAGLVLLEADSLVPPVQWRPAAGVPSVANGQRHLTLPLTNATRFYRLSLP